MASWGSCFEAALVFVGQCIVFPIFISCFGGYMVYCKIMDFLEYVCRRIWALILRIRAFLLLQGLLRPPWSRTHLRKHSRRRALSNPSRPSESLWWRRIVRSGAAPPPSPPPELCLFLTRLVPDVRIIIYRLVLPPRDPHSVINPYSRRGWAVKYKQPGPRRPPKRPFPETRCCEMHCDFKYQPRLPGPSPEWQELLTLPLTCKNM